MDLVPDEETGGFCFTWTIQNFCFCLQKRGEKLDSPLFTLHRGDSTKWQIGLYPKAPKVRDTISCYLFKVDGEDISTAVSLVFSIRTNSGFYKKQEKVTDSLKKGEGCGRTMFVNYKELLKQGDDGFLENDTLSVRCRIWLNSSETFGQCHARTILHVERTSFIWTWENFKDIQNEINSTDVPTNSVGTPSFTISLFLTEEGFAQKKLQIEIKQIKTLKPNLFKCDIDLLNSKGKFIQFIRDEHNFEISEVPQTWKLPIILKSKLMAETEQYLSNATQSLRFKFAISTGVKYNEIENTEYDIEEESIVGCHNQLVDSESPASLNVDLQHIFTEHKFNDLTLRTPGKDFDVHKVILCARSAVFNAMFDHDTKENRTGVVEIEDLEEDIVSEMLLFVYTDTIAEELDWENASKLYFAADKYGISALKRKCSNFLKGHLNTANVCDALVLADLHQDEGMKSAAQDFVVDHASECMITEEWKNFMKGSAHHLASETMHLLIMKNLNI